MVGRTWKPGLLVLPQVEGTGLAGQGQVQVQDNADLPSLKRWWQRLHTWLLWRPMPCKHSFAKHLTQQPQVIHQDTGPAGDPSPSLHHRQLTLAYVHRGPGLLRASLCPRHAVWATAPGDPLLSQSPPLPNYNTFWGGCGSVTSTKGLLPVVSGEDSRGILRDTVCVSPPGGTERWILELLCAELGSCWAPLAPRSQGAGVGPGPVCVWRGSTPPFQPLEPHGGALARPRLVCRSP